MNNKRILVTGGAGFIGSHLTKRLVNMGANVSVLVKYHSLIDNVRISSIWDKVSVVECDLRNIDSLRQFKGKTYDVIFHLAAYNHVGDSFLHVNESLTSNLMATANLLEHAPEFDLFVYIATSEVYGYQESVPFQESFLPAPISPYAVGKYAGELFARMKRVQTGKKIVCLRPFNTFGPYQSDRAIIPELIIKSLRGEPIETTGGKQTREFNYVDNIIDAFLALAESDSQADEVINIGCGEEVAICDLARKIHALSNSKSELHIGALQDRPTEIWRMCADNTKAKNLLNWKPKVSFDDGLGLTIDWFRKYLEVYYNNSSTLNQL